MIPRNYYVITDTKAFAHSSLQHKHHSHVEHNGLAIGHVDWDGAEPSHRTAFESQSGVIHIGTLFHKTIPAQALIALAPYGVTGEDGPMEAMEKVQKVTGGFQIEI